MDIDKVKNILIKSGWNEDHHISTDIIQSVYKKYGFPIFSNVVQILEKLGFIKIIFFNKKSNKEDYFDFNFEEACKIEAPERLEEEYNIRTQSQLTVIGTAYRNYYIIMVDGKNQVYMAYDSLLFKCGNSIEEAIINIVNDNEFIEIPYMDD
ncbi:MAG: SUKH-3 domain-containing protein [Flavobacteriales bacterium]|nr:SUKH-3 domain-containing protein [Flavobacteriales bacterium]